jgi:hypothetical protein
MPPPRAFCALLSSFNNVGWSRQDKNKLNPRHAVADPTICQFGPLRPALVQAAVVEERAYLEH